MLIKHNNVTPYYIHHGEKLMDGQKQDLAHATPKGCMDMRELRMFYIENNMLEDLSHINQSLAHAEEELYGIPFSQNLKELDRCLNENQLQAQLQSEAY